MRQLTEEKEVDDEEEEEGGGEAAAARRRTLNVRDKGPARGVSPAGDDL